MRLMQLRAALPWIVGGSVIAWLSSLGLAIYLGLAAKADGNTHVSRLLANQADVMARQIDGDMAQYALALRDAARLPQPRDGGPAAPKVPLLELPLTAQYVGFINVLNEVGDVVADPRSNVSRPANFAGRDYFQDHVRNPADTIMIGRPFGTAPNQHASIPISQRLDHPDGSFAGVVVAGVHLTWLSDLLSRPSPGPRPTITIRRDDGVILMRAPYDPDTIARGSASDPSWQQYLRTGLSSAPGDPAGIRLFRRLEAPRLVLELALDREGLAADEWSWLLWLPLLTCIPGLGVLGLAVTAHRLRSHIGGLQTAAITINEERIRLLANMSHELRTPLTGIIGQVEMMTVEGGLSDRQATRVIQLTEACTLMRNIVDRVIDFDRPGDFLEIPRLMPCDLDPLIRACLGMVEGEARRKGLLLSSTVDPATPRRVMAAHDQLQEVLTNLLHNAVKYTAQGTIALRVRGNSTRLWFEVADTGRGIPQDKKWRLFRPYDRLDSPAFQADGTGLGLTITEHLVKAMGGSIGHRDNPAGGSVFWIELPIAEPDPLVAKAAEATLPPPPEPARLRILLADDLDLTRRITADFLRTGGHVVTEAPDGEAAIAEIQAQDFDVVLTDMRMPIVDGLEVTRRIRAIPGHRGRTPVVLVTADLAVLNANVSGPAGVNTRGELLAAVSTAARQSPVPEAGAATNLVLDESVLGELRQCLSDEAYRSHVQVASRRIDDLITLLQSPDADGSTPLRDAVHDLIGVAGLLGLTALSVNLQWFETADDRLEATAALVEAAAAAIRALRHQLEPAGADR